MQVPRHRRPRSRNSPRARRARTTATGDRDDCLLAALGRSTALARGDLANRARLLRLRVSSKGGVDERGFQQRDRGLRGRRRGS